MLVIDPAEDFRQLAAQFLAIEWPLVTVDEWDPRSRGEVPAFFPLSEYDAVLLAHDPGLRNGLEWLRKLVKREDCPPVIFLGHGPHEHLRTRAIEGGAFEYLDKNDFSKARLIDAVDAAVKLRSARDEAREPVDSGPAIPYDDSRSSFKLSGAAPPAEAPPISINGYRVLEKIGTGGMATVYLAEREGDGLRLVLKVMKERLTAENEFLRRFIEEYGLLSNIDCKQVVRIYDQGVTDQHIYIAMEHFGGGDLRARIQNGVSADDAVRILTEVAHALCAVHAHGIVHRDLKPDNVMFRADGSLGLVDFGIATQHAQQVDLTAHGDVLGTPHYVSPEQACARPADARSDLYSLGIVFFEMLTGRRPFSGKDAGSLAQKHVTEPLPRLPADLAHYQELLDCLSAKRPEDRFPSARRLLAYIEANAATLRSPAEPPPRTRIDETIYTVANAKTSTRDHTSSVAKPSAAFDVLDVKTTLEIRCGDASDFKEVAQTLKRTVQPLLILLSEALQDGNLLYLREATRLLRHAIGAVEAPQVVRSAVELESHATTRNLDIVEADLERLRTLCARLVDEVSCMASA